MLILILTHTPCFLGFFFFSVFIVPTKREILDCIVPVTDCDSFMCFDHYLLFVFLMSVNSGFLISTIFTLE